MVVITVSPGQLGNKLFQYAYFLGNALEHGYELATLDFEDYSEHFEFTATDPTGAFPARIAPVRHQKPLIDLLLKLLRARKPLRLGKTAILDIRRSHDDRKEHYLLDSAAFQDLAKRPMLYTAGYYFRDKQNLFRHRETITHFLRPVERHRLAVENHVQPMREHYLAGIHIRHGDYAKYQGGRFFYSLEQYKELMRQISEQAPKSVHFLVASNAPFTPEDFAPFPVTLAPGDMIQDLFCLSECDVILGPPSTYSLWASFQHLRPLIQVYDPNEPIDLLNAIPIHEDIAP